MVRDSVSVYVLDLVNKTLQRLLHTTRVPPRHESSIYTLLLGLLVEAGELACADFHHTLSTATVEDCLSMTSLLLELLGICTAEHLILGIGWLQDVPKVSWAILA